MNYEEYIDKMINVQKALLEFFEENSSAEENFEILITIIKEQQIMEDQHELKEILWLVSSISNNHCRINNFNNKVEQIILYLKDKITEYFSNSEIFQLFEYNKRILLFLILEGIMKIDEYVFSRLPNNKYHGMNNPDYFLQEINEFLAEILIKGSAKAEVIENIKKERSNEIDEKRKLGENDDYLCKLIRLNEVKEFGAYVNKNNISLQSFIKESKFETNQFLMKQKKVSFIEYAAFFGSIEIIKYMKINGDVELTPSMWLYAIHSQNAELIKYLEDNHISPPKNDYIPILKESIKCHHNDVSNYIMDYLIQEENPQYNDKNSFKESLDQCAVECRNYCFFPEKTKCKSMLYYFCKYDYYTLVKFCLENENIDINDIIIEILMISMTFEIRSIHDI